MRIIHTIQGCMKHQQNGPTFLPLLMNRQITGQTCTYLEDNSTSFLYAISNKISKSICL